MPTTVVTGGAGFVASHLIDRLLARGETVIAVDNFSTGDERNIAHLKDNPRFSVMRHDITEPLVIEADINRIYNLACPASPFQYQQQPIQTIKTSTLGMINMLELALAHGARILQASTSEVYGDPQVHPQTEDYWGYVNPIGPRSCYDEGKRVAETLCMDYHRQRQLDIRLPRIFNTYGPRMHPQDGRVVSNFIVQAMAGEPITMYGDGSQTRSFCYVDDLVTGLIAMMDQDTDIGPINLGNPLEITVKQLAEMIVRLTGSTSELVFRPLPTDDPKQRQPDISKAKDLLAWEPATSLEVGLGKTIDYFKQLL